MATLTVTFSDGDDYDHAYQFAKIVGDIAPYMVDNVDVHLRLDAEDEPSDDNAEGMQY
jgi:hypothetical protein